MKIKSRKDIQLLIAAQLVLTLCTMCAASCSQQECVPNSISCLGNKLITCNAAGMIQNTENCSFGCDSSGSEAECLCPPEMVKLSAFNACIDRYEASAGPGGKAVSVPDAMPWTNVTQAQAEAACLAAGKRLCSDNEWMAAAAGPGPRRTYPYGEVFDPHTCNIPEHGLRTVLPTGSMPTCEGGFPGVYDLAGNVWEWIGPVGPRAARAYGGSFRHKAGPFNSSLDARGEFLADFTMDSIGFRCCLSAGDRPPQRPSMTFVVQVPEGTPAEDTVQLVSAFHVWPLEKTGTNEWRGTVDIQDGPGGDYSVAFDTTPPIFKYTYSHGEGYLGGEYLPGDPDSNTFFFNSSRSVSFIDGGEQRDVVARWRFWPEAGETLPDYQATTSDFAPRVGGLEFQAGLAPCDYWSKELVWVLESTDRVMLEANATWAFWGAIAAYNSLDPLPTIGFPLDDSLPFPSEEIMHMTLRAMKNDGLKILMGIGIGSDTPDVQHRTPEWWDAWYEQYRGFLLQSLEIAKVEGVEAAVLAAWGIDIALPGAGYAPADAEARFRAILSEAHAVFPKPIGVMLLMMSPFGEPRLPSPWELVEPLKDQFDFVAVSVWQSLAGDGNATQEELDASVEAAFSGSLDVLYAQTHLPIVLGPIAYGSYDGGAVNDHDVYEVALAPFYPEGEAPLPYDGVEQAMVYQALMKAVAARPHVVGFYPFNFTFVTMPKAPDYSVRGKAAATVLAQWYARAKR